MAFTTAWNNKQYYLQSDYKYHDDALRIAAGIRKNGRRLARVKQITNFPRNSLLQGRWGVWVRER